MLESAASSVFQDTPAVMPSRPAVATSPEITGAVRSGSGGVVKLDGIAGGGVSVAELDSVPIDVTR